MGILNIRPAKRGGSKAIIAIAGVSGDGKTYTALQIARGMVSKASEIGFLDTENKRGSLYAEILDGPFMIGDLYPPFSPERYCEAIKEFQAAGVKVLVVDSVSHEWEGEGGCDDIANAPKADGTPRKIANWIGAKRSHKRFMNTLLQSDMNIIVCIRAREKTDFKDPNKPTSLGVQPICEKNFMFEMTASLLIQAEGKRQKFIKMPFFLKDAFGPGEGYLGIETGKKIMKWLDTGEKEDPEVKKAHSELLMVCEKGSAELKKTWDALPTAMKKKLKDNAPVYVASAKEYDRLAEEAEKDPAEKLSDIQKQTGKGPTNLP